MEYERIHKPQEGTLSPTKLRLKLLGIQKSRKEEEEYQDSAQFEPQDLDEQGVSNSGNCNHLTEGSTVTLASEVIHDLSVPSTKDYRPKEKAQNTPKSSNSLENGNFPLPLRIQEESNTDYDSGHESTASSVFEFHKGDKVSSHRSSLGPFGRSPPSKWDDAEKWVDTQYANKPKLGVTHMQGTHGLGSKKAGFPGHGVRQVAPGANNLAVKVVTEAPVAEQRSLVPDDADTKRIDPSQAKREIGAQKFSFPLTGANTTKPTNWHIDPCPSSDGLSYQVVDQRQFSCGDSFAKPSFLVEKPLVDSEVTLSRHDSSTSVHSATTCIPPPSTVRSVSMRDMGTEMTPIASQEPSRTGTPVRATSPMRSPLSSQPSTPGRAAPTSSPVDAGDNVLDYNLDLSKNEMTEKELQMKTRREIVALGTQLGKTNIAAWASKEEEDKDASTSLKTLDVERPGRSVIETRAAAWEEAEKAKYMARYKREEIKIQAWENHQKAKTEAEMRRIEVEVERMRGRAHEKLMNKLAAARHKAEEKRAAAEAKKNQQAARTAQQAEYIRRTGRIPSSLVCWTWCR
ncbi:uncharacterized protein LOC18437710 isoform X2 [Amborella trichopoda]|uniref:uncharacterized protein LOC18437710 isoform X2 n=1 Tax=Amborella trichopoda TaxID=13333 RepID=UPI0005D33EAC|nr:uncharacterized protein LOC18437710 isoform X2 [Amborella trichopoda]|eukprot:XP_011624687.1 uncharacterized protein LOC18437710 isoform X2 [Amborella trichopoda]